MSTAINHGGQKPKRKKERPPAKERPQSSGGATLIEVGDAREFRLFRALDLNRNGSISRRDFEEALTREGLSLDDFRITECVASLAEHGMSDSISYEEFSRIARPNILLIERALQGNMVLPDFEDFCTDIRRLYKETVDHVGSLPDTLEGQGAVADYIPQLARVDPHYFGVSLCTIDGQRLALGDARERFCVQSTCKPINYCLALEERGLDKVHHHIGREPSGRGFNELALYKDQKPHNPMINAGAIMACSLIRPKADHADRFDYVLKQWSRLMGGEKPRYNNAVYLSERATADRNFALGYYMREKRAFPEEIDTESRMVKTLEFYFQCCSIELNAENMATVAATLANGGVCPTSGEKIFSTETVQNCLSLMYSCGMYDYSGEWAFSIGLPAKSGVAGALMIVIPNVMGICTWSPRLDPVGNSRRGIEFCRRLVKTFNFHNYDNLTGQSSKKDPRLNRILAEAENVQELIWAASKGDVGAIQRLATRGIELNPPDYDQRTPLHLAAAEGQDRVVKLLLDYGIPPNPRDRWGGTPLDDAYIQGHTNVIKLLEAREGERGDVQSYASEVDPAGAAPMVETDMVVELIWAASKGDIRAIQQLVARGIALDGADYDLRTPMHLAAAEGQRLVVQYFIDQGVGLSPRDRWGGTPLDDAIRHGHHDVARLLEKHGAVTGKKIHVPT